MALLVLIDWVIILFFGADLPPLYGLTLLACPGNGFAAYCAPIALFTLFVAPGTLVAALFVNLTRKRRRDREELDSTTTRRRWQTNLPFYASVTLTVAYPVYGLFFISYFFGGPPFGQDILN